MDILTGTTREIREGLATGDHDKHLEALHEAEEAGRGRKSALSAIRGRKTWTRTPRREGEAFVLVVSVKISDQLNERMIKAGAGATSGRRSSFVRDAIDEKIDRLEE